MQRQAFSKPVAKCDEPWEVRPSAHYHMGGLRADADGASVKGEGAGARNGLFDGGPSHGRALRCEPPRLDITDGSICIRFPRRPRRDRRPPVPSKARIDDAFAPVIAATTKRFGQKATLPRPL